MNSTSPLNITDTDVNPWQSTLASLAYAHQTPEVAGETKLSPEDFRVTELMDVKPSGEGEHYWLDISKTRLNTDQVAKALARFAGVAYKDVGYSGLKDFHAVTRQWFSVWLPSGDKRAALDWSEFAIDKVEVHSISQHNRKIKRSTHMANQFEIVVRELGLSPRSDSQMSIETLLEERLLKVIKHGVPNYFGEQRFGRNAGNMDQAYDMLVNNKRVNKGNLRGLLLSSARSWLFNCIVSERVNDGSWECLKPNEPANLNGSNSHFISDDEQSPGELERRLKALDIHPTAPMWGDGADRFMIQSKELAALERTVLEPYQGLCNGLEAARVNYQRRPLRIALQNLKWSFIENQLSLSFSLPPGQFATSVLREIVIPKALL